MAGQKKAGQTSRLAVTLRTRGNVAEALPLSRAAMEGLVRILGDRHAHLLGTMTGLGKILTADGELDGGTAADWMNSAEGGRSLNIESARSVTGNRRRR